MGSVQFARVLNIDDNYNNICDTFIVNQFSFSLFPVILNEYLLFCKEEKNLNLQTFPLPSATDTRVSPVRMYAVGV